MHRGILRSWAAITLITIVSVGAGFAAWESYVPRTLKSVIDANRTQLSGDVTYTASNFPTRATVTYRGKIQPIPAPRLKFLDEYLGKFRGHPEWVSQYSYQVLCCEGLEDYWLPIQTGVLKYFKNEVSSGARVELFVTWLGAQQNGKQVDWIFSINEFQVPKDNTK